jgi:hypothetical protein
MIAWATEIKIRAERRTGELLRETAKQSGARGTAGPGRGHKTESSANDAVLPHSLKDPNSSGSPHPEAFTGSAARMPASVSALIASALAVAPSRPAACP